MALASLILTQFSSSAHHHCEPLARNDGGRTSVRILATAFAEVLSPDGSLAVFGHVPVGLPAPLLAQFKQIYLRRTGYWGPPPEAWYLLNGPFKGWFEESGAFGTVEHKSYPWKWQHTTSSYTDFLRTRSDHWMLEGAKREEVLGEVAKAIDDYGGELDVDYETHLYIARRLKRE